MVVVEMPALSRFWFTFGAARRDKPFKTSYVGYKLTSCGRSPFRSIMLICALAAIGWPSMLSCDRELEPGGRKIHWMAPYLDLETEIIVNDDKRPWLQLRSGVATYIPGETTFNVVRPMRRLRLSTRCDAYSPRTHFPRTLSPRTLSPRIHAHSSTHTASATSQRLLGAAALEGENWYMLNSVRGKNGRYGGVANLTYIPATDFEGMDQLNFTGDRIRYYPREVKSHTHFFPICHISSIFPMCQRDHFFMQDYGGRAQYRADGGALFVDPFNWYGEERKGLKCINMGHMEVASQTLETTGASGPIRIWAGVIPAPLIYT